ncbi:MAG: ATP phosphoribosyltransferase regulatory subunit [Clostridiales bacterium]|nr:ATP phosphoribosyltransferase regulatory subunit [Clostridiales bacterium]
MNKNMATPKGTRDILLEECETQIWLEDKLKDSFVRYGYYPVITPGIEYLDVYADAPGNAGSEFMLKLINSEGEILVLRPDSTAPIARLTASRLKNSSKPVRLYYNQRVYRQKEIYSGRRIEISQMGVELIGANSIRADLEMLQLAVEALENCGLPEYRIELGHGGLCELLLSRLGLDDSGKEQLRQWIQAKNYPALSDFLGAMEQGDEVLAVKALPELFGGREVLDKASSIFHDEESQEIIAYMRALFDVLQELGLKDKLMLDMGFVNDNDYYTGIIFQAYASGSGEAVLLGGRYDRLLERFGEELPAVGFGVNVDLLTKCCMDEGRQAGVRAPQVLVWGEAGYEVLSLQYASTLRQAPGTIVENGLFDHLEQCKAYAAARGIGQIHVVGQRITVLSL